MNKNINNFDCIDENNLSFTNQPQQYQVIFHPMFMISHSDPIFSSKDHDTEDQIHCFRP